MQCLGDIVPCELQSRKDSLELWDAFTSKLILAQLITCNENKSSMWKTGISLSPRYSQLCLQCCLRRFWKQIPVSLNLLPDELFFPWRSVLAWKKCASGRGIYANVCSLTPPKKAQIRAPLSPLQTAWTGFDPQVYNSGSSSAVLAYIYIN